MPRVKKVKPNKVTQDEAFQSSVWLNTALPAHSSLLSGLSDGVELVTRKLVTNACGHPDKH